LARQLVEISRRIQQGLSQAGRGDGLCEFP